MKICESLFRYPNINFRFIKTKRMPLNESKITSELLRARSLARKTNVAKAHK